MYCKVIDFPSVTDPNKHSGQKGLCCEHKSIHALSTCVLFYTCWLYWLFSNKRAQLARGVSRPPDKSFVDTENRAADKFTTLKQFTEILNVFFYFILCVQVLLLWDSDEFPAESGSSYCFYSCSGLLCFAFAHDLQLNPLSLNAHKHTNVCVCVCTELTVRTSRLLEGSQKEF